jgi:hypothetical protein
VLVLVVGVLALMAIVVVVYTTIGQADRRGAASTVRQARAQEQAEAIADYLANVIAQGTFKHVKQRDLSGLDQNALSFRYPADYPAIDPLRVVEPSSVPATLKPHLKASTDGSIATVWPTGNGPDRRTVGDPWLATTMPERLGNLSLSSANPDALPFDASQPWRDQRDWKMISNAAPDQRFVNLANIRNNFNAESGIGLAPDGRPRTTWGLTLLDPTASSSPELTPAPTLNLPRPALTYSNSARSAIAWQTTPSQAQPDYYPADYTANQVGLARPRLHGPNDQIRTTLPRTYAGTVPTSLVPGDHEWLSNQYADTDGDGLLDARWFELVDASQLDTNGRPIARSVVSASGPTRTFVATRIVDLSSKANVNTATQFASKPTSEHPAGLTPGDVDLERLLMGYDTYFGLRIPNYEALSQPSLAYTPGSTASNPANYRLDFAYDADASWDTGSGTIKDQVFDFVGRSAFSALLDQRSQVLTIAQTAYANYNSDIPFEDGTYPPDGFARQIPPDVAPDQAAYFPGYRVSAKDRAQLYNLVRDPKAISVYNVSTNNAQAAEAQYLPAAPFTLADELELRTYEGVNDPERTSRLEAVLSGRTPSFANLSPLRSNRGLDLESLDRDRVVNNNPAQIIPDSSYLVDTDTMLQPQIDKRRLLTTISGGRLLSTTQIGASTTALLPGEIPLDASAALDALDDAARRTDPNQSFPNAIPRPVWADIQASASLLFGGAADALLPYSAEWTSAIRPWDADNAPGTPNRGKTLFYAGSRVVPAIGPQGVDPAASGGEVALRIAAHWTLNLMDSRQRYTVEPTTAGLPVVEAADRPSQFILIAGGDGDNGRNVREYLDARPDADGDGLHDFPEWNGADEFVGNGTPSNRLLLNAPRAVGRLDLGAARLAPGTGDPANPPTRTTGRTPVQGLSAPAVRVLGIKPQPFITYAGSMVMYCSKYDTSGSGKIKLDGTRDSSNSSYIFELVAFHLHNPFDVELSLSKLKIDQSGRYVNAEENSVVDLSQGELRYYIEFAGKHYALAATDRTLSTDSSTELKNITLRPGETRVVFISDATIPRIFSRMKVIENNITQADFDLWFDSQFNLGPNPREAAIRLARIDPERMTIIPTPSSGRLGVLRDDDPEANRVVNLWRTVWTVREDQAGQNSTRNDTLVDRLRDPYEVTDTSTPAPRAGARKATLDRRLPQDSIDIAGVNANTTKPGHTITRSGRFRRPGDPRLNGVLPRGALPAYCVEVKAPVPYDTGGSLPPGPAARFPGVGSLNVSWQDPLSTGPLWANVDVDQEVSSGAFSLPYGARSLWGDPNVSLIQQQTSRGVTIRELGTEPRNYSRSETNGFFPGLGIAQIPNRSGLRWQEASPADPTASAWTAYTELPLQLPVVNSSVAITTTFGNVGSAVAPQPLRAADLLLPLGVGPEHNPAALRDGSLDLRDSENWRVNLDVQWTTLGEAMALALDYDSPADPYDPQYRLGAVDPAELGVSPAVPPANYVQGALLKGRLRTDRFIAFVDNGGSGPNGLLDEGANPPETRRGNGLPMALNLLDRLRTSPTGSRSGMIAGTININTAPKQVQMALPMVAPAPDRLWGWAVNPVDVTRGLFDPANDVWDVSASLLAYRDKQVEYSRYNSTNGTPFRLTADFRDRTNVHTLPGNPAYNATNPLTWRGRENATGIVGVRENPGFVSAAEVLAARLRPIAGANPNVNLERLQLSVDREGRSGKPPRLLQEAGPTSPGIGGVQSLAYRNVATTGNTQPLPGGVPDSPSSANAIAAAVLNTISVRSDLFCVWFVVNSYTAADCEGLRPEDPLVPSSAKRYVMVVDRSNVVSSADKPRILMLQEVPLR